MQETSYLYGAPWFAGLPLDSKEGFVAPLSQVELYFDFLKKAPQDVRLLIEQAGNEYIAIAAGMQQLGVRFHVTHLNGIPQLDGLARIFEEGFNASPVPLSKNIPHELIFYPRDMFECIKIQKAILLNPQIRKFAEVPKKSGCEIYFSPYGEGGGTLCIGNIMVVGGKYINERIMFRSDKALDALRRKGLKVVPLPSPVIRTFTKKELGDKAGADEHIDRSMNLVEAPDGSLHLIVDPNILLAAPKEEKKQFSLIYPEEAIEIIKYICEPFGIKVHCPSRLSIPCSIGFMQFTNKKILMTNGDDALYKLLEKIIGCGNVVKTYVPIIITPIFGRAGIRCTINEYPEIMAQIFPSMA